MKALVLLLVLAVGVCTTEKIVCYFSSWAVYRPEPGSYDVDDIDPHLCTHLIFSFAGLSNYTWQIEVLDPWNELCPPEGNNCAYKRFVALKDFNPSLTILLAIGGWNEGSEDYSRMAEDPSKRATFVRSVVSLLHLHGFEGLDFDWEYPTQRGGAPQDKENFITLMTELKEAFDASSPRLILTGALAAGKSIIDEAYDMERLIPLFDQLHIMAYDYHGCFETFTHHNAPLCGYYADTGDMAYFNVNFTVSYYLDLGVPKDKLVMGTPLYGRCYTLDNFEEHGMLAPAHSCGAAGPYVRIPGTLAANEICERLKRDRSCTVVHDPNLHEPYFYCMSDYLWCGYDDADSLYLKARYVKNLGLAGVVIWTMDEDDFHGMCYDETSHLIKHMKEALDKEAGGDEIRCDSPPLPTTTPTTTTTTTPTTTSTTTPTTTTTTTTTTTPTTTTTTTTPTTTTTTTPTTTSTTTTPTTTTTTTPTTTSTTTTTPTTTTTIMPGPTTTPSPFARPNCTGVADGTIFPHMDCDKYWECEHGGATLMSCAPGTLFDITIPGCNWEDEVDKSQCRYWSCQIENLKYPAENCDEFYECEHGAPILRSCSPLYWNQEIENCDRPENVDTSLCNEPDY
ncbi:acidic mammalian chitinase-like isoform X2 [Macrobrachium nipponense]|uniref:acidic mammalian chitinase-like isoform X2 n=1 Tax=Macrobrachium nipponense TaxID=159736 RepID=UPI0030C8619F